MRLGALSTALFMAGGALSLLDNVSQTSSSKPPTLHKGESVPARHPGSPTPLQLAVKTYLGENFNRKNHLEEKHHAKDNQDRVSIIVKVSNDWKLDPFVYQMSSKIARMVGGRETYKQALFIHKYIQENIEYVRDPYGIDVFQSVLQSFLLGRGDCDDMTIAVCTLGMSIGIPCRIKTVRTLTKDDKGQWVPNSDWNHVYAMVGVRGPMGGVNWYASDPTSKKFKLGMEIHPALTLETEEYDAATGELVRRWINPKLRG